MSEAYEPLQRRFNFGDLVHIVDDPNKVWRIVSYTVEVFFSPEETTKDLMYDLINIDTDEYTGGFDEELTLVASAEHSDEFMANRERREQAVSKVKERIDIEEIKPASSFQWDDATLRKLVDYLLDRYNDYTALASDLKGIAPKAALREWRKLAKECMKDLREVTGGDLNG